MIIFKIIAKDYAMAAKIQSILDHHEIKYDDYVEKASVVKKAFNAGKPVRRTRITKSELMAVTLSIQKHPGWNDKAIGKDTNVSGPTVGRIRRGEHTLQKVTNEKT